MSKTLARWIEFDVESMTGTSTLTVYLDTTGGLEKTASGIRIKASGVTNDMLAGSIGLDKLAKAVIAADGSQNFTANQSMGGNKLTNLSQGSDPTDAVTLAQLQAYLTGMDFQSDVMNTQADATLDPGETPSDGDRYIITDSANLHTNFGTITGLENGDIVRYSDTAGAFEVVYDVSERGEGVLAWDMANDVWMQWNGSAWSQHGGLTGVTAGDGLAKSGNTMSVNVVDLAGTGLEDDGSNNLRISAAAAGNGLTGGAGSALAVQPDATTGGDVASVSVSANGVGVDVTALDGDHLSVDYTPVNYTPTDTPAEAADVDDLAAHLAGIDAALGSAGTGTRKEQMVAIDSTIVTQGYFALTHNFESEGLVAVAPVGGPRQINKANVGATGVTPDFECLNSNQVHINTNGAGTGLSDAFQAGDVLIVDYAAA